VQIALKHEAETIKIQIVEIIVKWILAVAIVNIDENGRVNVNTYISCPISKNPSNKNEAKAVALANVR